MRKVHFIAVAAALALAGCQTAEERDVSIGMRDGVVKKQLHEEFVQYQRAKGPIQSKCYRTYPGDPATAEYCIANNQAAAKGYIKMKVIRASTSKPKKGHLDLYQRCELAYWGDYEMAQACVDNEQAVATMSATQGRT